MGHKIDNQMLQIYNRCTQGSSDQGSKISEREALDLIRRAEEINNNSHSSSYSTEHRRGNKHLMRLMREHKNNFSADGQKLIQRYVRTGQLTNVSIDSGSFGGHRVDNSSGNINHGNGISHPGDSVVGSHDDGHGNNIDDIPSVGGRVGEMGPFGKIILDFTAKKLTWGCHWFPMQETRPGGDPVNNLYANGGPLHKLDMITGGDACKYEFENNRKAVDSGREFHWWGHCNNAAEAACILPEPRHGVTKEAKDGSLIKFTRGDIQGLLVKITPCLIDKVDFRGERFNVASRDNPNEPAPAMFMDVIKEWAQNGEPFVLDIDRQEQVWNFPYDQVLIQESDQSPEGFSGIAGPNVKYYHIEMAGTGYDEKRRIYECYVKRDQRGNVLDSGWIKTPNTHNNPDFMWRPHVVGDVLDRNTWKVRDGARMSNPKVDPQEVYNLYMESLA